MAQSTNRTTSKLKKRLKKPTNAAMKRPANALDELDSLWEKHDPYSAEEMGLKPRDDYTADELYRLLWHEKIVNTVLSKDNYRLQTGTNSLSRLTGFAIGCSVVALIVAIVS